MSIAFGLLDSSLAQTASIVWDARGFSVTVGGGRIVKSLLVNRNDTVPVMTRYAGWAVRTLDVAEANIRPIVFEGASRDTIGYVFPATSFDPDSGFSPGRLESPFERIYANAAVDLIVSGGIANDFVQVKYDDLADESKLSDILAPNCSIVVVALRIAGGHNLKQEYLRLALQEFGYFLSPPKEKTSHKQFVMREAGARRVLAPSVAVEPFIEQISEMIALASSQATSASALIAYYQVFELLSHERFKTEVARIATDPVFANDAWLLREKLTQAANEKRRINALVECCRADDSGVVQAIDRIGKQILGPLGLDSLDDYSAGDVFYKIRNLIVHDQKSVPAASFALLEDFVNVVHQATFCLIRSYDPEFGVPGRSGTAPIAPPNPRSVRRFGSMLKALMEMVVKRLTAALGGVKAPS